MFNLFLIDFEKTRLFVRLYVFLLYSPFHTIMVQQNLGFHFIKEIIINKESILNKNYEFILFGVETLDT